METWLRNQRLEELAQFLESKVNPVNFDMRNYFTYPRQSKLSVCNVIQELNLEPGKDCQTAACIAGWAIVLFKPTFDYDTTAMETGQRLLGLSEQEADGLFLNFKLDTPKEAAKALRGLKVREKI